MVAATPGGIEAQETAGQKTLVANFDKLPSRDVFGKPLPTEQLQKLGFQVGEMVDGDEIWTSVTPPPGLANETHRSFNAQRCPRRQRAQAFRRFLQGGLL
jgi:hypothetical protein